MRKKNLILSILVLLFADIVYFIWMPYPKSFLKTMGSSTFVFDLITNLIYFVAYSMILLISVKSIANPEYKITKKNAIIHISICTGVQIGLDFLELIAGRMLQWWEPLSDNFFTILELLILVLITIHRLQVKSIHWKRFCVILLPYAAVALMVFFLLDLRDIQEAKYVSEKYIYYLLDTELSHEANAMIANIDFLHESRNAILDFLSSAATMASLYFSTASVRAVDNEEYHTKEAHFVTRIVSILLLSWVICGVKILIFPQNSLNRISMPTHCEKGEGFNRNTFEYIVWRTGDYFSEKEKVYHQTNFNLKYEEKQIHRFTLKCAPPSMIKSHWEGNQLILDEDRGRIEIDGIEVIICYDKAFAYLKDGTPYVVAVEDIVAEEYDEILLDVCKNMVEEGRFEFFEYICEYILKYDPAFIEPYLERYCIGDFSNTELQQMGDINPDYITKCAKQFVSQ